MGTWGGNFSPSDWLPQRSCEFVVFSSFDTHRHNVLARVPSQCGTKHSPCRYELGVGDLQFGSDKEHHQRFLNRALGETKFFQEIVYFANVPYRVAHWGSMVGVMEHHEHGDVVWTCGSRVEAPRAALTRKRRCRVAQVPGLFEFLEAFPTELVEWALRFVDKRRSSA